MSTNEALNIQVIPQSDTISLELDDRINLRFFPNNLAITPEAYFAGTGEFIRDVTSVRIMDDDSELLCAIIVKSWQTVTLQCNDTFLHFQV